MNPPQSPLPPKKEVALALLERSSVYVHLDPRRSGVAVPAWFKRQSHLVLQIGLNMPVPIPDLRLDEEGMTCTLSFNRSPFFCAMPWTSIYALVGEDGLHAMVWPEDVPPEVAAQARTAQPKSVPVPVESPKRPKLTLAGGEPAAKAKKPRKKSVKEDGATDASPRLTAVPAPRSEESNPLRREEDRPSPPGGPPPQPPRDGGHKPKRELPPYLRVVK
jgi:hypothetical protein